MPVYISEYSLQAQDFQSQAIAAPREPSIAKQRVDVPGTSQPFNERTSFIMVHTDEDVHVDIGQTPAATINLDRWGAGERLYFGVKAFHRIDVVGG